MIHSLQSIKNSEKKWKKKCNKLAIYLSGEYNSKAVKACKPQDQYTFTSTQNIDRITSTGKGSDRKNKPKMSCKPPIRVRVRIGRSGRYMGVIPPYNPTCAFRISNALNIRGICWMFSLSKRNYNVVSLNNNHVSLTAQVIKRSKWA